MQEIKQKEKFHLKNIFDGYEVALARYIYVTGDENDQESLKENIINEDY